MEEKPSVLSGVLSFYSDDTGTVREDGGSFCFLSALHYQYKDISQNSVLPARSLLPDILILVYGKRMIFHNRQVLDIQREP